MKLSYKWLRNYIDIDLNGKALEHELTFSGIEVEAVEHQGELLEQIIVAEIKSREAHPGSEHLSICQVDNGEEILQVICGAANCAAGSKVALAPVGADLGEFKIKRAKLRGEESYGMLCSEKELGISDNHDGIMILDENFEPGRHLSDYYDKSDVIFDVEITPNRPDLLCITGIARDLSALLHKSLQMPEPVLPAGKGDIRKLLKLENQATDLCTRYTARMIKDVKIGASPQWLKRSLEAVGMRSINNVVDVTNYVMLELGHPLHAFDYKLVAEQTILMRRGQAGERFTDLQNITHDLNAEDLVIADPQKVIALAGVIGAANSQISEETRDIIIESANFLYNSVRRTSKRLSIFTDSAYRFERDMSDEQAELASRRCCELILQTAGGELVSGMLDSYPKPVGTILVTIRPGRVEKVLSVKIAPEQIRRYLESLGLILHKEEAESMEFEIPHYRKDLTREIDLIEEIIRLYGYNNIEQKLQIRKIMNYDIFRNRRQVQDMLVSLGFCEVVNWSFSDPADLDKLRIEEADERRRFVTLKNPLGSSYAIMRPVLLPDILRNVLSNINYGQKSLKLFEMNKVFRQSSGKLAQEDYHLCGVMTGNREQVFWGRKVEDLDFYDIKGVVEDILSVMRLRNWEERNSDERYYQSGTGLDFYLSSVKLASMGKLDGKVCRSYGIEQVCYSFDIYLDAIYRQKRELIPAYQEIAKFPPVLRDLSFVISREFDVSEIRKTILESGGKQISQIVLFDEYKGKNIAAEKRSLTFSLTFSSSKKTLNDDIIAREMHNIIQNLEKKYRIELR
ncbi:MAG: phenylalanine--tRNA ligase subunit beta [Candidatus Cloacimonetes bacterium]|nr:phenylalanine--tRNA ligase subunit beta [Candidatus Cloacimonadota bacterium]